MIHDLRHDRGVANRKLGGVGRRLWVSAWLPPGLALGWLAVLSAFVHGAGVLLAAWATTTALGLLVVLTVLALQRRTATPPPQSQSAVQPSSAPSGKTEPARPGDGTDQAVTSTAHGADPNPPARSSAGPIAHDSASEPAPTAAEAEASVPPAGPAVGELAVTLGLHVLTTAEVASVLRVETKVIAKAISNGELPGNQIGGDWRVDLGALRRWLEGRYPAPGAISGPHAPALSGDEQT